MSNPSVSDSSRASLPARRWRLRDVVDFEAYLEADRSGDTSAAEARDRAIWTHAIRDRLPDGGAKADRRMVFRLWLEARRREHQTDDPTPGDLFESTRRMLLTILTVFGASLGGLAAGQLLRYDGVQPVNVAAYLGALVMFQIGLILLAAGLFAWRRWIVRSVAWSPWIALLRWAWTGLARMSRRQVLSRIPAEKREQTAAAWGFASVLGGLYRPVYAWVLLGLLQWFAVCFNVAALLVTLALVFFSDRAFGWQSAMNISPEQVHRVVQTMAAPWSWMGGLGAAAPSLAQIEGSRIILKDGIRQLATENLVAWWPFLCCALAAYGLAPRAVLGLTAWWGTRRSLAQLSFHHVACDRLWDRLQAHELLTTGQGDQPELKPLPDLAALSAAGSSQGPAQTLQADEAVILVDSDLPAGEQLEPLPSMIRQRLMWQSACLVASPMDAPSLAQSILQWPRWIWTDDQPKVAVLLEAWKPPIAENREALRLLRSHFGSKAKICLALVGRPQAGCCLTAVSPNDWQIWERMVIAMGDPMLRVERLVAHG